MYIRLPFLNPSEIFSVGNTLQMYEIFQSKKLFCKYFFLSVYLRLFHCCFFEKWQFKSNFAPSKPKTMTTTKKRVAAFDVLKGIAIYLVVMGHVLTMCIRDIDSAVLFKLVGEIHMPIFFFISGYFTYKLTGNGDFAMPNLRKRFWQLIIPFLAVSALWMWYFPHSRLQSPLSQSWPQLLTTYWKDGYWFTLTLFEVVLVYAGISRLMTAARRLWMQVAIPAAAYLALILVSPLISDPAANFDPVGIGLLTQFFPVFMMGVFARKYSEAFRRMATQPWVATAAVIVAFAAWYYSVYTWEFPALPAWCQFVAQPVLHASLMTVVFGMVYRSDVETFASTRAGRWLTLLGNESLGIYLLHYFFLFPLTPLQEPMRMLGLTFMPSVMVSAFFAFFIILAALGANWAIGKNRVLAFLLIGKTVKKDIK